MYHRCAASKRTFTYVDHRIFQRVWRWCRGRHRKKSRKWIKEKYFQQTVTATGFSPACCETRKARLADPVDGSGEGTDHSLCEDTQRRQSLRSEVGTVPGSTDGLATGPNAHRSQSDRVLMEGTRGTMYGLRSTAADSRGRLPDPPSDLAQSRRSDTADNLELMHANCHRQIHVQERRTEATASRKGRS